MCLVRQTKHFFLSAREFSIKPLNVLLLNLLGRWIRQAAAFVPTRIPILSECHTWSLITVVLSRVSFTFGSHIFLTENQRVFRSSFMFKRSSRMSSKARSLVCNITTFSKKLQLPSSGQITKTSKGSTKNYIERANNKSEAVLNSFSLKMEKPGSSETLVTTRLQRPLLSTFRSCKIFRLNPELGNGPIARYKISSSLRKSPVFWDVTTCRLHSYHDQNQFSASIWRQSTKNAIHWRWKH